MAVILIHEGVTQEEYEEVVRRLSEGKSRMESVTDWPVAGLLMHAAGESPRGFRVVDVWDSEESCERFGRILAPILEEMGLDAPPEVYPSHTFVSGQMFITRDA